MIFARTSSGLSNQYRFFSTDLVVYVEGKREERQRLLLDDGDAQSMDALFWREVLRASHDGLHVHFKELGSKGALLELSSLLGEGASGRVLVCVDRDFDDFKPPTEGHRCLARTFAYSWEGDVWTMQVVGDIVESLLPVANLPGRAQSYLAGVWQSFYGRIGRFVVLDAKFVLNGMPGLLDRDSPSAVIAVDKALPPGVNRAFFKARMRRIRAVCPKPWRYALPFQVDTRRYLFGKSAMCFGYQVVVHLLRYLGVASQLSLEITSGMAVRMFGVRLRGGLDEARLDYYRSELAAAGLPARD